MTIEISTAPTAPVSAPAAPARDWALAMLRGAMLRCPACGKGRLFSRFVTVNHDCPSCGEALHHQRADDLPPYVVITIVGHIIVGGLLLAEKYGDWPMWWHMALWPALTVILSIALMQPVKGGVVGLQWALRMHGFGGEADQPERQPLPPRGRQP